MSGLDFVDGYAPSLTFGSGGHDGCNGFGADYEPSGSALTITMTFINQAGCLPDVAAAADAFQAAIAAIDSYEVSTDRLTLRGPAIELVFEAPPTVDFDQIVDVTWLLEAFIHEGDRTLIEGSVGFLELSGDGSLVGSTGCRELSGTWQAGSGNVVVFTSLRADGTCRRSLVDQDGFVIGVLEGRADLAHDGETLEARALGNQSLVFRRAEPGEAPAVVSPTEQVGFDHDPSVSWIVSDLDGMDYVEVVAEPGADGPIVGEVEAGERLIAAGTETVVIDGVEWRQIHKIDSAEGWIPDRYLVRVD